MADDLVDSIAQNAQGPRSGRGDSVSFEQHSLADQIAADQYLGRKRARRNPLAALKFVKIVPPGTSSTNVSENA